MVKKLAGNKLVIKGILFLISSLFSANLWAQENVSKPEMAFEMRSSGKIYVVVAVLAVIFAGIVIFLIAMDRKVTRLEARFKEEKS